MLQMIIGLFTLCAVLVLGGMVVIISGIVSDIKERKLQKELGE